MSKHGTASQVPGWFVEFQSAALRALPRDISQEIADAWRNNGEALTKAFRKLLIPPLVEPKPEHLINCDTDPFIPNGWSVEEHRKSGIVKWDPAILTEWKEFYRKLFGMECDISSILIPPRREDFGRLLVIPDIKLETLYTKCKESFPCWRWTDDDLDKIVTWNERDAKNGAYAIWVRDAVEADEYLKNIPVNDIRAKNLTTETLAERLIHELRIFNWVSNVVNSGENVKNIMANDIKVKKNLTTETLAERLIHGLRFFADTGKHLDIRNITLCSGSHYSDGSVPFVGSDPGVGGVVVSRYFPASARGGLRLREVVS